MSYEFLAMSDDFMEYQGLVERAMKNVVREALFKVAEDGLPGEHHLYITFLTGHSGVIIADRLRVQYPKEMTIVLQHQFWDLNLTHDHFEITLSFSGKSEKLTIPFDSIVSFADPSVNFGLQFKDIQGDTNGDTLGELAEIEPKEIVRESDNAPNKPSPEELDEEIVRKTGEVVALDAFRKNKT